MEAAAKQLAVDGGAELVTEALLVDGVLASSLSIVESGLHLLVALVPHSIAGLIQNLPSHRFPESLELHKSDLQLC